VGAEDGPLRERPVDGGVAGAGGALAHRPLRGAVVLGLHGAEPAHGVLGGLEAGSLQAQAVQPPVCDVTAVHVDHIQVATIAGRNDLWLEL
jgi:hypothetical protein